MQKADGVKSGKEICISITDKEHNTWNGIAVKGEETISFSSELELIHLIEAWYEQSGEQG